MRFRQIFLFMVTAALLLLSGNRGWAAFGEDTEKPKPEFSQEGGDWIAKLTPRAKSNPIQIRFHVGGGTLVEVAAREFAAGDMPDVDPKTFRSDFFTLRASPGAPGGEVTLSLSCDYFTTATEIWGPKEKGSRTWGTIKAVTTGPKEGETEKTKTLTLNVKDGGALDADGVADGRIEVILGPQDSFWGYALGTLVIRFFGVFLVLGILMIGMIISGKVFQSIDARGEMKKVAPPVEEGLAIEPDPDAPRAEITGAMAAAVAIALQLHAGGASRTLSLTRLETQGTSSWSLTGRTQLMADRMSAFDRVQRN
ncbi:MAG: choice-of-anchor U domain-containing protein [Pseudomonadota bacterium]